MENAVIRAYNINRCDIEFCKVSQAKHALAICRKSKLPATIWTDEPSVVTIACDLATAKRLCKTMYIEFEWYESALPEKENDE